MIYNLSVTAPASTAEASPESDYLDLPAGTIEQVFLTFPLGCCGLVGARVLVRERVLWPSNPDNWFINNGFTYPFRENLRVDEGGERFTLEVYNTDQVYDHTVTLNITLFDEGGLTLAELMALRLPVYVTGGPSYG